MLLQSDPVTKLSSFNSTQVWCWIENTDEYRNQEGGGADRIKTDE